jgi:hypothetical protein
VEVAVSLPASPRFGEFVQPAFVAWVAGSEDGVVGEACLDEGVLVGRLVAVAREVPVDEEALVPEVAFGARVARVEAEGAGAVDGGAVAVAGEPGDLEPRVVGGFLEDDDVVVGALVAEDVVVDLEVSEVGARAIEPGGAEFVAVPVVDADAFDLVRDFGPEVVDVVLFDLALGPPEDDGLGSGPEEGGGDDDGAREVGLASAGGASVADVFRVGVDGSAVERCEAEALELLGLEGVEDSFFAADLQRCYGVPRAVAQSSFTMSVRVMAPVCEATTSLIQASEARTSPRAGAM